MDNLDYLNQGEIEQNQEYFDFDDSSVNLSYETEFNHHDSDKESYMETRQKTMETLLSHKAEATEQDRNGNGISDSLENFAFGVETLLPVGMILAGIIAMYVGFFTQSQQEYAEEVGMGLITLGAYGTSKAKKRG